MCWSLVQALEKSCSVCAVLSGERALSQLRLNSNDLLILGCGCSDLSCAELTRQCKQIQPTLKIVLLGSVPLDQAECDCYQVDIRCFHEKPFDLSELLRDLEGLLHGETHLANR